MAAPPPTAQVPPDGLWHIQLLGGLGAAEGARVLSRFPTYKTAALFAYLAFHASRPHPREMLLELLWPESPPNAGRNSLSVALGSLRRQLEPPGTPAGAVLQASRSSVQLDPRAIRTDVAGFEAAARRASALGDAPGAQAALQEAVRLYQGDLLPGHYEDWVGAERERLKDVFLDVLRRLIRLCSDARALDAAIGFAHQAILTDPLREGSHRTLMRLYAASGRPAAALDHFQHTKRLLKQELNAVPARATRSLAEEIAGKLNLHDPERPAPDPPQERLPLPLTRFFGRDVERSGVGALLADPHVRLVTLTGTGGVGKTRLALEAASDSSGVFAGRACFVSLADAADHTRLVKAVQAALGLPDVPHTDPGEQIVAALSGRRWLLILDNFEHLVEGGSAVVQDLLTRVRTLTCLVTSRELLNLGGEREYAVSPLPLPAPSGRLAEIADSPSVQLFVDRAQARRADFQITPENIRAVAALCVALEGLPLALELAAAWARVLSPAQMLARLRRRFEFLQSRGRDLPARHRSLRAVLDSSYCFLPPDLQRLFAGLSVFPGGWTPEAAVGVCGDAGEEEITLDLLRRLQEKSLITAEEVQGEMRGRMLETLREYAAAHLTPADACHLARRHAAHFARLAARAREPLAGPDQAHWMSLLEADLGNLRAALSWGVSGDPELALRLASDLTRFWSYRGYASEGRAALAAALAAAGAAVPEGLRLRALGEAGALASAQGDYAAARSLLEQSLRGCRTLRDRAGEAAALGRLGEILMNEGNYAAAQASLTQALAGNAALGDGAGEAENLGALGYIARERGDYPASRSFLERAVRACEGRGDVLMAAAHRGSLAFAVLAQGDLAGAGGFLQQTLADYRRLGNRPGQAWALASLAQIERTCEKLESAIAHLGEALAINRGIGNRAGEAWNLDALGAALASRGDNEAARKALEQALTINRQVGARSAEAWTLCHLGDAAATAGELAAARGFYTEALTLMRLLGMHQASAATQAALAKASAGE